MITISICMIVKNEEKVLERCLESLKGLAEEIIIVDTGSTDATKEIAARYTQHIYDFKWIDDFAAARNFSFSKASMNYIYVADADEVIDDENRERFLSLKEHLLPEIDIVQMMYANQLEFNTTYNFDMEYRPKLYKRLRNFMWTDPIHESIVLEPLVYDSDIIIQHRPTSNHAKRDFGVFQKVIHREGKLSDKLYEMYARELFIAGEDKDFLEALPYYEGIVEHEEMNDHKRKICECVLTRCYRINNDISSLMKASLKNIADGKASAEVCYELGEYFYELQDYKEATIWYYNAAFETECELNIHYGGDYSLKRLSECYRELGIPEQEKEFEQLYKTWCINHVEQNKVMSE